MQISSNCTYQYSRDNRQRTTRFSFTRSPARFILYLYIYKKFKNVFFNTTAAEGCDFDEPCQRGLVTNAVLRNREDTEVFLLETREKSFELNEPAVFVEGRIFIGKKQHKDTNQGIKTFYSFPFMC